MDPTKPLWAEPADAPIMGGVSGALTRFGTGFRQGFTPNIMQALSRGANPTAYLLGGLVEGIGDAVRGTTWWQRMLGGKDIPGWMKPNAPMKDNAPAAWKPPAWNGEDTLEGQGPSYGVEKPLNSLGVLPSWATPPPSRGYQGNRAGTRGSTIAEGEAANDMAQGMVAAAQQAQMAAAQRQFRNRMDTIQK